MLNLLPQLDGLITLTRDEAGACRQVHTHNTRDDAQLNFQRNYMHTLPYMRTLTHSREEDQAHPHK